jgi:hypothetical protein
MSAAQPEGGAAASRCNWSWLAGALAALNMLSGGNVAHAEDATAKAAATALEAKYVELGRQLENNPFQKPLYLESSQPSGELKANVYAVLGHPFDVVRAELKQPARWCDILILHPNTKYCRPSAAGTLLKVNIGRKSDQPIEKSYRVDFDYRVREAGANYLAVALNADEGPMGTRDYRLLLEAVPLKDGRTFMHLAYSYGYGTAAKLALLAYLNTAGSNKVGFTETGKRKDGQPVYIDGLRGLIERNTMRYYLAIEAHLGSLAAPPSARVEQRSVDWCAASERYPRQLHDIAQSEYLALKRKEYQRQQSDL